MQAASLLSMLRLPVVLMQAEWVRMTRTRVWMCPSQCGRGWRGRLGAFRVRGGAMVRPVLRRERWRMQRVELPGVTPQGLQALGTAVVRVHAQAS